MCHYKNLGRLCFLVGLIVGLSSLLVAHSDIQRTLGFYAWDDWLWAVFWFVLVCGTDKK